MTKQEQRVRKVRAEAKQAGYRQLHYDGEYYSLIGERSHYGLTIDEAEALVKEARA